MNTTAKKLRPYQVRLVTDFCRATGDVLVEQPTGSGKTVQIVTLVAMHLGQRYTHDGGFFITHSAMTEIQNRFTANPPPPLADGFAHP